HVVAARGAAQVVQGQGLQPVEIEGRGDLVVGPAEVLGLHWQRVVQPGEDEDLLWPSLANDGPGVLEFPEVVFSAGEDSAPRVRQGRGKGVTEAVHPFPHDDWLLFSMKTTEHTKRSPEPTPSPGPCANQDEPEATRSRRKRVSVWVSRPSFSSSASPC